jgi:uncharacterized membrane protein YagU involved in acid resistance
VIRSAGRPLDGTALSTIIYATLADWFLIDAYLVVTHGLIFHDASALEVSQWDASNALGMAAFRGGIATAALGAALHFVVSLVWTAAYVIAALRVPALLRRPFASGVVFGLVVMAVMKYLIVPLGHASVPTTMHPLQLLNQILAHIAAFGLPVAYIAAARLRERAA